MRKDNNRPGVQRPSIKTLLRGSTTNKLRFDLRHKQKFLFWSKAPNLLGIHSTSCFLRSISPLIKWAWRNSKLSSPYNTDVTWNFTSVLPYADTSSTTRTNITTVIHDNGQCQITLRYTGKKKKTFYTWINFTSAYIGGFNQRAASKESKFIFYYSETQGRIKCLCSSKLRYHAEIQQDVLTTEKKVTLTFATC